MRLIVNGQTRDSEAADIAALLAEMDYAESVVATALNGDFVARGERAATPLDEGDWVEILAPMKGG